MENNFNINFQDEGKGNITYENYKYRGEIDADQTIKFVSDLNKFAFQKFICKNSQYEEVKYDAVTKFYVHILDIKRNRSLDLLSCVFRFSYSSDNQSAFEVTSTYSLEEFEQRYREYQLKG